MKRKVAVIGSDGRAAAITRRLTEERCHVYAFPGNAGMWDWNGVDFFHTDLADHRQIVRQVQSKGCSLTVVSPEQPLADGIVDSFHSAGLAIVGPTKAAAEIETSKIFSGNLLGAADVPAPRFACFQQGHIKEALTWLGANWQGSIVVKADGLMGGKGVVVARSLKEARAAVGKFIVEGPILLQEFLEGQECSFQVFTDGVAAIPLLPVRDYKPLLDGDKGPNTGSMGGYAPYPLDQDTQESIMQKIVYPTINHMAKIGRLYCGIMYFGLMLTKDGPKVLEINCRLGDPEAESILPLLESNFYDLLQATTVNGQLEKLSVRWWDNKSVTVTLAADGYPKAPRKGDIIYGLGDMGQFASVHVSPAGVARNQEGKMVTAGGRVVYVTAQGKNFASARKQAYLAAQHICFQGKQFRTDIAQERCQGAAA